MRLGINTRRVDYLASHGKLADNGKKGKARRFKYEDEQGVSSEPCGEDIDSAKLRKTIAEANLKEMQLKDTKRAYIHEAINMLSDAITTNLEPYARELAKAEYKKLQGIYDQCWKALELDLSQRLNALFGE